MLNASLIVEKLHAGGVTLATGVPDSLLANFCQFLDSTASKLTHVANTSEGAAIALASGHHLGTGQLGLVYLQNSGLGNAVNPITSLTSARVCSIPMVLLIGWRGEITENGDQIADEPQHIHQGEITLPLLNLLDIPFWILSNQSNEAEQQIEKALRASFTLSSPVALVVRKNLFLPPDAKYSKLNYDFPSRESVVRKTFDLIPPEWPIVATTGKTAREAYEISSKLGRKERTFLCVGAMGHAVQIASGIAFASHQRIICLDGDGSALMHLGSLAVSSKADRLLHIMINNGVHESVGSQPIADQTLNFSKLASEMGYRHTWRVSSLDDFSEVLAQCFSIDGSIFIEAMTTSGSRDNLSRPNETPKFNKEQFIEFMLKMKAKHYVI